MFLVQKSRSRLVSPTVADSTNSTNSTKYTAFHKFHKFHKLSGATAEATTEKFRSGRKRLAATTHRPARRTLPQHSPKTAIVCGICGMSAEFVEFVEFPQIPRELRKTLKSLQRSSNIWQVIKKSFRPKILFVCEE